MSTRFPACHRATGTACTFSTAALGRRTPMLHGVMDVDGVQFKLVHTFYVLVRLSGRT